MAKTRTQLFTPQTPGDVLKQIVLKGDRRITQEELAAALDVSRLSVNQLMGGKRSVTADMALRLSYVLGTTPEFWLNIQRDVDLFGARLSFEEKRGKLRTLRSSVKR